VTSPTTVPTFTVTDERPGLYTIRNCWREAVAHVYADDRATVEAYAAAWDVREQRDALVKACADLAAYVDGYEWGRPWAGRPHAEMDAVRLAIARAKGGAS
jgi:hypothetical protein